MQLHIDTVTTPIGTVLLVAEGPRLCALDFSDYEPRMMALLTKYYGQFIMKRAINPHGFTEKVSQYFAGKLDALDAIEVFAGGTDFQKKVWAALRNIPPAVTYSYGQLAASLEMPKASRAVGMANSQNPVALVVPCHRVVGANGTLTGYAGGLWRKEWLLAHEKTHCSASDFAYTAATIN